MAARLTSPFAALDQMVSELATAARSTAPLPLDLYREDDRFVVKVDLPGVDADSIDVNVEDGNLTIRAERSAPDSKNRQWLSRERPVGTYARRLTVGSGVAVDAIEADYTDGVLTLTLPVAEEAKPRKIEVRRSKAPVAIEAS